MAGEQWRFSGKAVYLKNEYYEKVDQMAKLGRRPKTTQLQMIIDFYLEHHPDALNEEA